MRILVVSDTHRRHTNFERIIREEDPFDYMLHLGDVGNDADYFAALAGCESEFVAGNNDWSQDLDSEKLITLCGKKIFMTHGHTYDVDWNLNRLFLRGKSLGADVILFGHLHCPIAETIQGIKIFNPGSITFPRQRDKRPSYLVLTLDEYQKEDLKYKFKFFEKTC